MPYTRPQWIEAFAEVQGRIERAQMLLAALDKAKIHPHGLEDDPAYQSDMPQPQRQVIRAEITTIINTCINKLQAGLV
jgi:hypothetical protein